MKVITEKEQDKMKNNGPFSIIEDCISMVKKMTTGIFTHV